MRKVDIYVEFIEGSENYSKLDLFEDEKIEISLSVQNIQDISKTFTDFTQSFTVPASANNNKIFEYYYQNDVDLKIDHNLRRNAYIEIQDSPFRTGKIQLEKANVNNNRVESYSVTFFGDLMTLKDKFQDDKLNTLDFSAYDFGSVAVGVLDRITNDAVDYDVRYPLISSKRLWQMSGGGVDDITSTGHHIEYTELFPAIRVKKIFDLIATKYGVTFSSVFFTQEHFNKLFLYLKNKDLNTLNTGYYIPDVPSNNDKYVDYTGNNYFYFNNPNDNKMYFRRRQDIDNRNNFLTGDFYTYLRYEGTIDVVCSISYSYTINVYHNGTIVNKINGTGTGTFQIFESIFHLNLKNTDVYVSITTNNPTTLNVRYNHISYGSKISYTLGVATTTTSITEYHSQSMSVVTTATTNLNSLVPDITISDFVSGILKQFNLTCYALNKTTFQVEPLDDWHSKGAVIDITKNVDIDSIDIERIPLYKNVEFKHQKSESLLNTKFVEDGNREYADVTKTYEYDGGDYTIELPFENLLFSNLDSANTIAGFCVNKNSQPYVPKPILLYMYDKLSTSFKFHDGASPTTITNYIPFGNDLKVNGINNSLTFSADQSPLLNIPIGNNIFSNFYYGYLSNLFNIKNRKVTIKAFLPISLMGRIRMNDRLIIRDKRYIINDIKTDLTSGESTLVLIHDFRKVINLGYSNNDATLGGGSFTASGGVVSFNVPMPNNASLISVSTTSSATFNTTSITTDTILEVTAPSYTSGYYLFADESGATITDEFNYSFRSEEGEPRVIDVILDYTLNGDETQQEVINLIQSE